MNKTNFKTIRLDEIEQEAVEGKIQETGLGQAAAIRLIIREWAEMKKQYITVPVAGMIRNESLEEEVERRR